MRRIKILQTIRQGQIGGGETHVLDLVSKLDSDVFDVEVLSFTDGEMVDRLNQLNIKCNVIYTEKAFDFKVWNKVSKYLHEEKFDIVHAHGTRAASNTFWAAKSNNTPLIYTVHGWSFHPDQNKIIHKLRAKSESFLTSMANVTVNVSHSNKSEGNRLFGLKGSQVIPNGVSIEKFKARSPKKCAQLRSSLSIPDGVQVVGFIARFTKQKSPLTFVHAAHQILKTYPEAVFLMVGDGELMEKTVQETKKLDIHDSFRFPGFRTDVPEMLSIMDIYCLPSQWEGLPIGVLEAMAMSKVVVAADVNGTSEVISEGENGFLFDTNNSDALATKVVTCLSDKALMKKISIGAVNTVTEEYQIDRMVKSIEDLYTKSFNPSKFKNKTN